MPQFVTSHVKHLVVGSQLAAEAPEALTVCPAVRGVWSGGTV